MRFRDFKIPLSENVSDPELEKLRAVISAKIKQLPETDQTYKTLKEIEDLLQNINAGGRLGLINNLMSEIPDSSVKQAQKELARYIAGINMSPKDRDELFRLWKSDNLINHKLLLSPGRHAFSDIVNSYNTNPAIKELTDDLMRVEAYGHGKGEFILNVFSKKIGKPETNKGDLIIDGKSIEVKTTDAGGARFGDQEVRPGDDFFDAVSNFRNTILKPIGYTGAAKSGINVNTIQKLYQDYKDKKKFQTAITPVVKGLFPAANVSECLRALFSGDYNTVRQAFAIASLENYLKQKKDYGVLYVDISKDPSIFIFFRNNEELNQAGFRLDISTQYLVTTDTQRVAAQFTIVPSNRLATQQLQQIVPQGTTLQSTNPKIADWVNRLATNRSITDPNVINQITKLTTDYLEQGYEVEQIIPALEKQFPQLKVVKRSSKKTVKNTAQPTQTDTRDLAHPAEVDLLKIKH